MRGAVVRAKNKPAVRVAGKKGHWSQAIQNRTKKGALLKGSLVK